MMTPLFPVIGLNYLVFRHVPADVRMAWLGGTSMVSYSIMTLVPQAFYYAPILLPFAVGNGMVAGSLYLVADLAAGGPKPARPPAILGVPGWSWPSLAGSVLAVASFGLIALYSATFRTTVPHLEDADLDNPKLKGWLWASKVNCLVSPEELFAIKHPPPEAEAAQFRELQRLASGEAGPFRAEAIRKSLEAAKISPDRVQKYLEDMEWKFTDSVLLCIKLLRPKLLPQNCESQQACVPYLEALLAYPVFLRAAPCLEDSPWPLTNEEVHENVIRWTRWLWIGGAKTPPPRWRGPSADKRIRSALSFEAAGAFAAPRRGAPGDRTAASALLNKVARSWDPSQTLSFRKMSVRQQHFETIFGDLGRTWRIGARGPLGVHTKAHADDFKGPRSWLRFYIYDLPVSAHREALSQLHGRIREAARTPAICDFGVSPCVEMREGGAFSGYRPYAAEATFLAKLLSGPDEVIVDDPNKASYFIVPFLSSTWCFIGAPKTWQQMALALGINVRVPLAGPRGPGAVPRRTPLRIEAPATSGVAKPLLAILAGWASQQRRGTCLQRHALPEVRTDPVRPDFWDGAGMVIFAKTDKGAPSLGRIGSFLDKQTFNGALAKLVADTGFDASLGSVRVYKASETGIQNVILVGVGAMEDWTKVGLAAAGELQDLEGKVALVCIDGVQVEQLVTGLLKGLDFSAGPKTVELLGAFPVGSGAAIEKAFQAF
eukprot:g2605.t1